MTKMNMNYYDTADAQYNDYRRAELELLQEEFPEDTEFFKTENYNENGYAFNDNGFSYTDDDYYDNYMNDGYTGTTDNMILRRKGQKNADNYILSDNDESYSCFSVYTAKAKDGKTEIVMGAKTKIEKQKTDKIYPEGVFVGLSRYAKEQRETPIEAEIETRLTHEKPLAELSSEDEYEWDGEEKHYTEFEKFIFKLYPLILTEKQTEYINAHLRQTTVNKCIRDNRSADSKIVLRIRETLLKAWNEFNNDPKKFMQKLKEKQRKRRYENNKKVCVNG